MEKSAKVAHNPTTPYASLHLLPYDEIQKDLQEISQTLETSKEYDSYIVERLSKKYNCSPGTILCIIKSSKKYSNTLRTRKNVRKVLTNSLKNSVIHFLSPHVNTVQNKITIPNISIVKQACEKFNLRQDQIRLIIKEWDYTMKHGPPPTNQHKTYHISEDERNQIKAFAQSNPLQLQEASFRFQRSISTVRRIAEFKSKRRRNRTIREKLDLLEYLTQHSNEGIVSLALVHQAVKKFQTTKTSVYEIIRPSSLKLEAASVKAQVEEFLLQNSKDCVIPITLLKEASEKFHFQMRRLRTMAQGFNLRIVREENYFEIVEFLKSTKDLKQACTKFKMWMPRMRKIAIECGIVKETRPKRAFQKKETRPKRAFQEKENSTEQNIKTTELKDFEDEADEETLLFNLLIEDVNLKKQSATATMGTGIKEEDGLTYEAQHLLHDNEHDFNFFQLHANETITQHAEKQASQHNTSQENSSSEDILAVSIDTDGDEHCNAFNSNFIVPDIIDMIGPVEDFHSVEEIEEFITNANENEPDFSNHIGETQWNHIIKSSQTNTTTQQKVKVEFEPIFWHEHLCFTPVHMWNVQNDHYQFLIKLLEEFRKYLESHQYHVTVGLFLGEKLKKQQIVLPRYEKILIEILSPCHLHQVKKDVVIVVFDELSQVRSYSCAKHSLWFIGEGEIIQENDFVSVLKEKQLITNARFFDVCASMQRFKCDQNQEVI